MSVFPGMGITTGTALVRGESLENDYAPRR
jgi:hypothetical protein